MRALLIDADSTIPNLALMKLSTFYKSSGYDVDFVRLELPYYPGRKKTVQNIDTSRYTATHCSTIFPGNKGFVAGENIDFGGTGYSVKKKLSNHIENLPPDYNLYPENDISYGYITRGCIRDCSFCWVRQKEGWIKKVKDPSEIVAHKKVKFLDNNILAFRGHLDILSELSEMDIKMQFIQGLDIRLLTKQNSELLGKLNYIGEYIFAFDSIDSEGIISRKLELMEWAADWRMKFYVYVHPDMPIRETVYRVGWLKSRKILPYLMRDIECWASENSDFYVDLAAYCNQPNVLKKMDFAEYLQKRAIKGPRKEKSLAVYNS